jgi:hypothetical protein
MMSVVFYLISVLVSFESASQETFVKAFGERPAGIPNFLFVLALQTLLYLPMPWVFWHAMWLVFQSIHDRRRFGIGYLLTAGDLHPDLRRSQRVCLGGPGDMTVDLEETPRRSSEPGARDGVKVGAKMQPPTRANEPPILGSPAATAGLLRLPSSARSLSLSSGSICRLAEGPAVPDR